MIEGTLRNLTGRTGIMFGNGEAQGGSNLGQEELGQNEELQVHFERLVRYVRYASVCAKDASGL